MIVNLEEFKLSGKAAAPHFLLIGNPVAHSLSPLMHNTAAEYYGMDTRYYAVKLETSELGSFAAYMNDDNLKGVNITIPYKELMLDYMDELSPGGRHIGAMNTIRKKNNKLVGHNTDAYGFMKPLERFKNEISLSRVIIFGTGGASKAIVYALQQWEVEEIVLVSRNPNQNTSVNRMRNTRIVSYDAWPSLVDEVGLIVNTTPLGMAPNEEKSAVQEYEIEYLEGTICYDIVYRPQRTTFLTMAEKAGARTIGGLEMLIHQGSRSFELWTEKSFPVDYIRKTLTDFLDNGH